MKKNAGVWLAFALLVAGCTGPVGSPGNHRQPSSSGSGGNDTITTSEPPETPSLAPVAADPGAKVFARVGHATGTQTVATFRAHGNLSVIYACRGVGSITVKYAPIGSASSRCTGAPYRDVAGVGAGGRQVTVSVAAGPDIDWTLVVQAG